MEGGNILEESTACVQALRMEPGTPEEPRKGRYSWKGREGQVAASIYLAALERDSGTDPEQQAIVEGLKAVFLRAPSGC